MNPDKEAEAYIEFMEDHWDRAFVIAQEKLGRDPSEEEVYKELDHLFQQELEHSSEPPEYNGDDL